MKRFLFIAMLLTIANLAFSADLIYSSAYLNQPFTAEMDALGGVSNSLPLGILNTGQNPASIDTTDKFSFAISQVFDIQDTRQNAIAAGYGKGMIDGNVYGFYSAIEDIEARTGPTDEPDYLFTARQMFIGANAALSPNEYFTAGIGVKIINEKIDLDKMNATAWDFGAVGRLYGFNLGFSIRNLGKSVKFQESLYKLPLAYSLGLSRNWRFITAEAFFHKPDLLEAEYGLNAQFDVNKWLTMRSGLRLNHDSRLFSAGATFNYQGFSLTYSFVPFRNDLGIRHSVGLSYGIIN